MGNWGHIARWVVILVLAVGAGLIVGHIPKADGDTPVVVSLSIAPSDTACAVEVAFTDHEGRMDSASQRTTFPTFNTLLFTFPATGLMDGLTITVHSSDPVKLSGIGILSGGFEKTITANELREKAEFIGCTATQGGPVDLVLTPQADRSTFRIPGRILLSPPALDRSWAIVAFLLSLFILAVFKRRCPRKKFFTVVASALLLAGLAGEALYSLMDLVDSATMYVECSTTRTGPETMEIYYSPDGLFRPDKIISNTFTGNKRVRVELPLPDGVHRALRLDIPSNDTVTLYAVEFDLPPFSMKLHREEILRSFALFNDLTYHIDSAGNPVFITGATDPNMAFFNADLQQKTNFVQVKKRLYPEWMALILFFILLFIFSRAHHLRTTAFASVFGLILLLPLIGMIFKEDTITLFTEKRLAAQKPQKWKGMKGSADEASAYVNDQFGGRKRLTTTWNMLTVVLFDQTLHTSPVVMGSDGWLYYTGEGVPEIYENKQPYTVEQLSKMCSVLEERRQWLALYGIDYYLLVPPIKYTIYPEYLPSRIKKRPGPSKLDQLETYLAEHSKVKVVDLREVLLAAKKKEKLPVYYKVDTHWNLIGAYYGYKALMERMAIDHPGLQKPKRQDQYIWDQSRSEAGDLALLISMNNYFLRDEVVPVPVDGYAAQIAPSIAYPTYQSPHPAEIRTVPDSTLPKLLMNRDSYTNFLMPFLSEHFQRSIYLWTPLFNPEVIKEEKPDIVVSEMLERFIGDLALDNPPMMRAELDSAARVTRSVP